MRIEEMDCSNFQRVLDTGAVTCLGKEFVLGASLGLANK